MKFRPYTDGTERVKLRVEYTIDARQLAAVDGVGGDLDPIVSISLGRAHHDDDRDLGSSRGLEQALELGTGLHPQLDHDPLRALEGFGEGLLELALIVEGEVSLVLDGPERDQALLGSPDPWSQQASHGQGQGHRPREHSHGQYSIHGYTVIVRSRIPLSPPASPSLQAGCAARGRRS